MIRRPVASVLVFAAAGGLGACARTPAVKVPPPTTASPRPGTVITEPPVGYGAQPAPSATSGTGIGRGAAMMQATGCAVAIRGTQVAANDTANGEDITFTTSVSELRQRVHALADDVNAQSAGGGAGAGSERGTTTGMPPVRAEVENIPAGARIHLTPLDPSRLAEMRQVFQQGALMMLGRCPRAPSTGANTR